MPHIVRNFRMSDRIYHYYDVDRYVGENQPNRRLDVMMVQFFLGHIMTHSGHPLITIQPDGRCGRSTIDAIHKFQETWNQRISASQPRVWEDAVVSPGSGRTFGRGQRATWTILALNALVGSDPNFGPDLFCRLHTHPDCPDPLKPFFASAPPPRRPPVTSVPQGLLAQMAPDRRARAESRQREGPGLLSRPRRSEDPDLLGTPAPGFAPSGLSEPFSEPETWAFGNDGGVRWAENVLRPGRRLFTSAEYTELLETMEGTGDWIDEERMALLLQALYFVLGDGYPPDISVVELQEYLRQDVELGRVPRPPRR